MGVCVYQILASFSSLWAVNRIKVYIERNNMQVELIQFCKKILPLFTFSFAKQGLFRQALFAQRDRWICAIDRSRCETDGST